MLEDISINEGPTQQTGRKRACMVVGPRKTTAEAEAIEAAGIAFNRTLAGKLATIIEFRNPDGSPDCLTANDLDILHVAGVTEDEYYLLQQKVKPCRQP